MSVSDRKQRAALGARLVVHAPHGAPSSVACRGRRHRRRSPRGAVLSAPSSAALLLVGLLAGAFVVWRRLTAAPEPAPPVIPYEPPAPSPEPAAA